MLLNFSPDHLDRHPDVDAYASAKGRIFENQEADDWAVVNADDPAALQLARRGVREAKTRLFGRRSSPPDGTAVESGWIVDRSGGGGQPVRLVPLDAIHLHGAHLVDDVIAAVTVGAIAKAAPPAMTAAVESFHGLEHAMEDVGRVDGVLFVNDSKATNVESALRAIESFDRDLVAIIGGRFKGGDLRLLREPLRQRAKGVVAIGESQALVRDALEGAVHVETAATFPAAIARALALARPSGVVLLAPACASFDMFKDYAERGRAFKEEAARLGARRL